MRTDPLGHTDSHPPIPGNDREAEIDHLAANRPHTFLLTAARSGTYGDGHYLRPTWRIAEFAAACVRRAFYFGALYEDGEGGYRRGSPTIITPDMVLGD